MLDISALPQTNVYISPNKKQYKVLLTQLIAVPTTLTQIIAFKMQYSAYIKQISILPSSNASANGVVFNLQYGTNVIEGLNGELSGIATPTNITFADAEYPYLNIGDNVIMNATSTTAGSYIQLAIVFML